jgi:5-methylcytosine-specific restriction protein B
VTPQWRAHRLEALRAHPAPDASLLAELHALETAALCPARTRAAIVTAARARRFLSYGEVAAASFLAWPEARRRMDAHLQGVCAASLRAGGPLLSAIVVNRTGLATGRMEARALAGFTAMAGRLGVTVGSNPADFLAREQTRVFDWAMTEHDDALHH